MTSRMVSYCSIELKWPTDSCNIYCFLYGIQIQIIPILLVYSSLWLCHLTKRNTRCFQEEILHIAVPQEYKRRVLNDEMSCSAMLVFNVVFAFHLQYCVSFYFILARVTVW